MEYEKLKNKEGDLSPQREVSFETELPSDMDTKELTDSDHKQYGTLPGTVGNGMAKISEMTEKQKHIMLIVMGLVSFLGNTQFSMVGPFYPQYVSTIMIVLSYIW